MAMRHLYLCSWREVQGGETVRRLQTRVPLALDAAEARRLAVKMIPGLHPEVTGEIIIDRAQRIRGSF
jgi:hypothetical protein